MKYLINICLLIFSCVGFSQTYFYEDFNYESLEVLDSLYQNQAKSSIWRTEHAVKNVDISENGTIEPEEQFKSTSIASDPFDENNKVIRFELNKVSPRFYAMHACDDDSHENVKTEDFLKTKYNESKKIYCTGCDDGPLGMDLGQWRTHMNRNELAIYGANRKLYKTRRDHWFGLKMLLHNEYELDDSDNPEIVTQFHILGKGAIYPPVALLIKNGRFVLAVIKNNDGQRDLYDMGPTEKNKWIDWKMHLVLSKRDKKGLIEIWRDGEKVQEISGKNMRKNFRMYLKIGIYKWGWWDCGLPVSNSYRKVISFDKIWASKTEEDQ